MTQKTKDAISKANLGKVMSEETKEVAIQWDLRDPREQDNQDYNIDFVQSFEVAEHIEEDYANVFIYNITKDTPDVILLTAGKPDQQSFKAAATLKDQGIHVSVLAMGTQDKTPLYHDPPFRLFKKHSLDGKSHRYTGIWCN